ncbi:MAG: Gfo/Idh/MocA family oxidoreductase [Anaerolineae bacterium]|nr:Gfo/Idh/MocA family oxidoreductase [Anaerolineae bacterium]
MRNLRFAMIGTGFWSTFQLAGWLEAGGVECVALCNRTVSKAAALGEQFGISKIYSIDEIEKMLDAEELDFIDICTNVETHYPFTRLAAERGIPVVCQKPMATTLAEAEQMVQVCRQAGVPLLINENWRWQYPIRQFKQVLESGVIGKPFRARIDYRNSFPVFDNQPFLKDLDQFILTDIGSHILDAARSLFGDAHRLYCQLYRAHPDIQGEDVATVMMNMGDNITVTCDMSYATRREHDRFPETYIEVEGTEGFLELGPDFWIRETTSAGTRSTRHKPPRYEWADPAYDVVHSSIVPAQASFVAALNGTGEAENTGEDNLKTVQLVFGSYVSARKQQVVMLPFTSGDEAV